MDILTAQQHKSAKIVIPFAIAGYVFYSSYAKKGSKDWKIALIMSLIVFVFAYVVASQTLRIIDPE